MSKLKKFSELSDKLKEKPGYEERAAEAKKQLDKENAEYYKTRFTHEKIEALTKVVSYAPWRVERFEEKVPEDVVDFFRAIKKIEEDFNKLDLPYKLVSYLELKDE